MINHKHGRVVSRVNIERNCQIAKKSSRKSLLSNNIVSFIQDSHGRHDWGNKSHSLRELPTPQVDREETCNISITCRLYKRSCCQCLNWLHESDTTLAIKKSFVKKTKLSSTTTINLFFRAIYIVVRYTHSFFEDIHPSSSEIFLKEKKRWHIMDNK